jgi:hypothetical protein
MHAFQFDSRAPTLLNTLASALLLLLLLLHLHAQLCLSAAQFAAALHYNSQIFFANAKLLELLKGLGEVIKELFLAAAVHINPLLEGLVFQQDNVTVVM